MSSDLDLIERLRTDPAPVMHVSIANVLAQGRRRQHRRTARWLAAGAAAAAAAALVVVVALQLAGPARTAPPAGTPSGISSGSYVWQPAQPELSGAATIVASGVSYALRVDGGVMTVKVARDGAGAATLSAALLSTGAAWREVDGTSGQRVLVGVVPGEAEDVVYEPSVAASMAEHTVVTRAAGDFTAYVISFPVPQNVTTIARDVGWLTTSAGMPTWALSDGGGSAGLALDMDGEAPSLLPPYDVTVTGPPSTTTPPRKAVELTISLGEVRLGAPLTASVDAGAVVAGSGGLQTQLVGADPETAFGYATISLADGRSLVWGVLPQGIKSVRPTVEGGVRVGIPALANLVVLPYTVFAVLVEGSPEQVVGLHAEFAGRPGGISVTR